jgi:hypothetical protein
VADREYHARKMHDIKLLDLFNDPVPDTYDTKGLMKNDRIVMNHEVRMTLSEGHVAYFKTLV